MVSDFKGATEGLKKALELGKERWDSETLSSRAAWIALLENGENPFPEGPGFLDHEQGLGWLR